MRVKYLFISSFCFVSLSLHLWKRRRRLEDEAERKDRAAPNSSRMMDSSFVSLCFPPLLSSCDFNLFFSSSISERERKMREMRGRGKTWAGCCRGVQWPVRLFLWLASLLSYVFSCQFPFCCQFPFAAMTGHGFFSFSFLLLSLMFNTLFGFR